VTAGVVVGVDPGGRMTGIAARCGATHLGHELVIRRTRGIFPGPAYLVEVCERVYAWTLAWPGVPVTLAIQGVHERQRRRRDVEERDDQGGGLIALGQVVGALEVCFPDALLVAPDGHGRNLLATYPEELVEPDELARLTGDGPLQHCRSAWDVAGRAICLLQHAARHQRRPQAAPVTPLPRRASSEAG
jgi:hypothetical protein